MRFIVGLLVIGFSLSSAYALESKRGDFGMQLDASTLGAGATFGVAVTPNIELVLGASRYSLDNTMRDKHNNIANGTVELQARRIGLQFYPFSKGNWFLIGPLFANMRAEMGLVDGGFGYSATVRNTGDTIRVNGKPLTYRGEIISGQEAGTVSTKIEMGDNGLAPYFAVGWGRISRKGLTLSFNLGVAEYGTPRGATSSSGCRLERVKFERIANKDAVPVLGDLAWRTTNAACTVAINNQLDGLQDDFEADTKDYAYYPFIGFGLAYGF